RPAARGAGAAGAAGVGPAGNRPPGRGRTGPGPGDDAPGGRRRTMSRGQQGDPGRISAFLDAQAAEAGAARNTLLAYGRDLRDFADWLAARGDSLMTVPREGVEDYLSHCDAQGLSRATRARRLSAIRQWTRFALDEGWRDDDPACRISGPGRTQRLPKVLD